MKRTFIAIKVNAGREVADLVDILSEEFKSDSVRWVDINKLHITLAFLGDTSEETIRDVSGMLRNSCTGFGQFSFKLSSLGLFRNIDDLRVIWAGIEDSGRLGDLFKNLKSGLDGMGIEIENREFKPHLTIGRVKWLKNKKSLEELIRKYEGQTFQVVVVREIIFYESILQPSGALYLPIKVFPLT